MSTRPSSQETERAIRNAIATTWIESPLGPLVAAATAEGICLLEFADRRALDSQFAALRQRFACAVIPILIPCHRVLDSSGRLRGYGGGLWRKKALLELERGRPGPA